MINDFLRADSMKQKELTNCTFVKTVLMFLVVLYHSALFWGGKWFICDPVFTAKPLVHFAHWLNSFHIYGFTLVSGYLFYHLKCEQKKYSEFALFVKNKVKRLLVPYIFISAVWAAPISAHFFQYSTVDLIQKYVLGTSPNQLWFLLMLFDVFIVFWWLSDFTSKHTLCSAAMVLGFYGLGIIGGKLLPNIFMVWTACTYIPIFWLGFKLRQANAELINKIPALIWILVDLILFAVVEFMPVQSALQKICLLGLTFVLHVWGSIMAFAILQRIANYINWHSKCFGFFSKRSMPIYLFHQQIIYFFIYWMNGILNPYLHMGVNFVSAIMISLCISAILMRFKIMRFLIGEK